MLHKICFQIFFFAMKLIFIVRTVEEPNMTTLVHTIY